MDSIEDVLGKKLQTKDGEKDTAEVIANKKVIGLYFSAHWCFPCSLFTPTLIEFYNSMKDNGKFEVIFISSDQSQEEFDEYYKEMPWATLSFSNTDAWERANARYLILEIPTLVLLNDKGKIITIDGRRDVAEGGQQIKFNCQ